MGQRDLQTRELENDSSAEPAQPRPPTNRRPPASATVIAALLVLALGVATFAAISTHRPGRVATGASTAATAMATFLPTWTPAQAPMRGAGLPKGVEVTTYAPTGPDEGWGTGGVITNSVNGMPERSIVLRYSAGSWMQIGPALYGVYLGGIDMVSSSEGWTMGGDSNGGRLLLHIHNGAWQQVPLPAVDPYGAPAVMAMRTPDEGWLAMANSQGAPGGVNTALLHYTGGAWSLVRNTPWHITDIAPIANGEAWVAGQNTNGTSSLVHVQGGKVTVILTSPANSTFSRLRMFAPNDIWIEGAMHASTNADINDTPLVYHFDGVSWSNVNLNAPNSVQHIGIVASDAVWGFASAQFPPPNQTAYGRIASIYSIVGGQWTALSVPYKDLQSIEVVSKNTSADVWAIGVYVVMTRLPDHNGAPSYAGINHYVLLRYTGSAWIEYGR